jgi:hypothetical protein
MRNRAKGTVGYMLGAIKNLDVNALYPEEIVALETIAKVASKLRKNWKKEIPEKS